MAYTVIFAAETAPVMSQLDQVFTQVGNLGLIPCGVSGTNALTLAQVAGRTPAITAYFDGLQLAGVVVTTNTTAVTALLGSLAALNVYKDSPAGPVACSGGELIGGNAFTLRYDTALNAGNGGWHLYSNTAYAGGTISGAVVINNNLSVASLASVTKLMVGASASSITRILTTLASLTYTVVPANSSQLQSAQLPGSQVNDSIAIGPPASVVPGTSFTGYVIAAGTIAIAANNITAASLTPVGGLYRITATGFT